MCKLIGHNPEWKFFHQQGDCLRCGLKGEKVIPQGKFLTAAFFQIRLNAVYIHELKELLKKKDDELAIFKQQRPLSWHCPKHCLTMKTSHGCPECQKEIKRGLANKS
jgi:hypothetical protein